MNRHRFWATVACLTVAIPVFSAGAEPAASQSSSGESPPSPAAAPPAAPSPAAPSPAAAPPTTAPPTTASPAAAGPQTSQAGTARSTAPLRTDPRGKTGVSPYFWALLKGVSAHLRGDYASAIGIYQEAIAANSNAALGYYLLGQTHVAQGDLPAAETAYNTGISKPESNDEIRAKLLFVSADLRERQAKWDEAKAAWNDYEQFISRHPQSGGHEATATDRIKRIQEHIELAKQGEAVRRRIEDRQKKGVTPPR